MRGLEGKGVLVTGASRGIGEAAARRFLEENSFTQNVVISNLELLLRKSKP